jgi:GNAT superfamily N-acetyltransferase
MLHADEQSTQQPLCSCSVCQQASTSSPGSAEAGKVVAQLMVTLEWSDWRANWVWWIQSVYCHPAARKQGHFKRLYAHVRAEAQAQGAAGLRLYADDGNTSAHAAYSKLGMSSHYKVFEDMFTGD